jgi:Putative DNA-binding domain
VRLLETQQLFAQALRQNNAALLAQLIDTGPVALEERLAIYRGTMLGTWGRALGLCYPAVRQLVGDEFFDNAAQRFALESPPANPDLDHYGLGFDRFLAEFPPASGLPYLPDVARLEQAVNRALHAPRVKPLKPERLAGLGGQALELACFVPHPSVSLLEVRYPADLIWRAVIEHDDAALGGLELDCQPLHLLVQRPYEDTSVVRLGAGAWHLARQIFEGEPLGEWQSADATVDLTEQLALHLAAGRLVSIRCPGLTAIQEPESDDDE